MRRLAWLRRESRSRSISISCASSSIRFIFCVWRDGWDSRVGGCAVWLRAGAECSRDQVARGNCT